MDEETFDTLARKIAQPHAVPRRTLLGILTGSLVVAVDTLHSLQAGDEAAAKGGSFGGQLGGRHGKNGRGRDKHHKRNRHHHKKKRGGGTSDNPLGMIPGSFNVRLIVENLTTASIDFEGWTRLQKQTPTRRCQKLDLQTIPPNTAPSFSSGTWSAIAILNNKYYIEAIDQHPDDGFPFVTIYYDGTMTIPYCYDGHFFVDTEYKELGVGQILSRTVDGQRFEIVRENDIGNERVFRIRVLA